MASGCAWVREEVTRPNPTALTIPVVLYQLWERQEWKAGIFGLEVAMAAQNFMSTSKRRRAGETGSKVIKRATRTAVLHACLLGGH